MSFNFPSSPALNDTYSPVGGPVFTWDGTAWKGTSQGAPVTVYVSDTAPLTPAIGQLWWNSATGTMAIWYADADSAQWVQVSGQVLPTAPSDNGEYVMVNGVWRLKSQSFSLTGLTQQILTVPAWGPSQARLTGHFFVTAATSTHVKVSLDGTTFLGGTSYTSGGWYHATGSGGFVNFSPAAGANVQVTSLADNVNIVNSAVVTTYLKPSSGGLYGVVFRGTSYNVAATNLWVDFQGSGYVSAAGVAPLKALMFVTSGPVFGPGDLTVEWLK